MKTMSCKQLGGACDAKFQGNTFEEIVDLSKVHGMEMFQKQDADHMEAMQRVMVMMQQPEVMQEFFEEKKKVFEALNAD
jgi:hypothetical protein